MFGGLCSGARSDELAEGPQGVRVDAHGLREPVAAVDDPVTDRLDLRQVLDGAVDLVLQGVHEEAQGFLVRGAVVVDLHVRAGPLAVVVDERAADAHALDDAPGEDVAVVPPVELVLQRRAAAVEGQDIHVLRSTGSGQPGQVSQGGSDRGAAWQHRAAEARASSDSRSPPHGVP